jgi:hypothetical protein
VREAIVNEAHVGILVAAEDNDFSVSRHRRGMEARRERVARGSQIGRRAEASGQW